MPYRRKYGTRKTRGTRKTTLNSRSRKSRATYRKGKYSKVSRKRTSWQAGTFVSPYRRFVYNDSGFTVNLTDLTFQQIYRFRGNSLYDPDYTGIGVQPYGFDQLCPTFYNNYNVRGSKITVYPSVAKTYETSFPPYFDCLVVPYRGPDLTYTELEDIRRMPYCRSIRFSAESQANHPTRVSSYAATNAILGPEFGKDVLASGQYDGSPTYVWYWLVVFDTTDWIPSATIKINFDVKIVYYSKLLRKQELNES